MSKLTGKYSNGYDFDQEDSDFLDTMADLFADLPGGAFLSVMDEFREQITTASENNHSDPGSR